jgi:hypothetical protein
VQMVQTHQPNGEFEFDPFLSDIKPR